MFEDVRTVAPAEPARIGGDVIDQVKHALGRVFDQGASADGRHEEYDGYPECLRIGDNT
ncbi:hypothetical protein D3C76_1865740 [compost metagenome]